MKLIISYIILYVTLGSLFIVASKENAEMKDILFWTFLSWRIGIFVKRRLKRNRITNNKTNTL